MQFKTIKEQIDNFGVFRLRGARCKGIPRAIDFTNPPYDFPKMWLINPIQTSINQGYLNSSHYLSRASNESVCQNIPKSLFLANFNMNAPIISTLCDYPILYFPLGRNTRLRSVFLV